jgi:hypothetical protein
MLWASVRLSRPADDQRGGLAARDIEHRRWCRSPDERRAFPTTMCRSGELNARSVREGAKIGSNTS